MSATDLTSAVTTETILYPESDGKPMADNSLQFRYITTIEGNLEILFEDQPDVFIAGDMLWYPVENNNRLRVAPDVMVAFGRPKGDRGSYLQWQEGDIAPQVVFEILSPGNTPAEMERKLGFYQDYGVEEYYLYDPHQGTLKGWLRRNKVLQPIAAMEGWVSPRLEVTFALEGVALALYYPDGSRFLTFLELNQMRRQAEAQAEVEAKARIEAEVQAEVEAKARAEAETYAKKLEAKLKQLGQL